MTNIKCAVFGASIGMGIVGMGCSESSPSPDPAPGAGCVATTIVSAKAASGDLRQRAYVASRDSGNITVIDLESLEIVATSESCGRGYHMVELSADFSKVYATSTDENELEVLDARAMEAKQRIAIGKHPTHLSLSKSKNLLAVMDEDDNAVSFVDPVSDVEVKRLPGFYLPHYMRFSPDGRYGYVANIGAHHITRVDLATLEIDGHVALDGFDGPPNATEAPDEGGFADAQIDRNGVLWAAHARTGRVLAYDVNAGKKLPDVVVGANPWIVFAEHPFANVDARAVANHGDKNISFIDRLAVSSATATVMTGEPESFGVNYSPLAPEKAFVMNRMRKEVAVINTRTKKIESVIDVGGNTETASTTADGRWIVAAVSSANRVVVIDATTDAIVKTFDNVGNYPWTVTIPLGQNYCH